MNKSKALKFFLQQRDEILKFKLEEEKRTGIKMDFSAALIRYMKLKNQENKD